MKIKKAIIPVAGKGTRFLPVTKTIPKEMIPLINVPMVYYVIKEAVDAGIEEIILVTSKGKESLESFFSPHKELEDFLLSNKKEKLYENIKHLSTMVKITPVIQTEQLGLGHAILQGAAHIEKDESFAVLLGDDLIFSDTACTKQLIDVSLKKSGSVIGVMSVPKEDTNLYGIVDGERLDEKTLKMSQMVEKPKPEIAPTTLATPGRYILHSNIFSYLEEIPKGAGGEYQLTDAINLMAQKENVFAFEFEGERFDTGQPKGYLEATIEMALKNDLYRDNFLESLKKRLHHHGITL